jgi:hypothetical protein
MKRKQDEEPEISEDEDYAYDVPDSVQTENVDSRMSANDFNTERLLYDIKKTMNGFDKRDGVWVRVTYPLCRTEFINNFINSIRSLVNFHNMFSITTAPESALNMLESLKEMTFYAVDSGVKEEHIETLINIYDTIKATFYGIIIDGRGTENIKQTLISAYKDIRDLQTLSNSSSPINWDYLQKNILNKNG